MPAAGSPVPPAAQSAALSSAVRGWVAAWRFSYLPPTVAVVLGVVMIVVAGAGLRHDRGAISSFTASTAVPAGGSRPGAERSARPAAAGDPAPAASGVPGAAAPGGAAASPARLVLPTLQVSAAVREVVTTDGVLGVPSDPAEVGWWTGSSPAGSPTGSTVLDGHVDSAVQGAGALFHLDQLRPGEPVVVRTAAGSAVTYQVYARQVYDKHQALPADLFAVAGPARLVLITCGGPFERTRRSYQDNIVVLATPVP